MNAEYYFADDNNEENQENDLKSAGDHEDSDEEGVQGHRSNHPSARERGD